MVPKHTNNPDEPARTLSPELEKRLEEALRACAASPADGSAMLRTVLQDAARDARERKVRAEELIVLLKSIERRIGLDLRDDDPNHDSFRTRMIEALLEAYYDR